MCWEDETPAQNSPKHILNVLNDNCIQEIFQKLKNRREFLNMANVCRRFRYVAQTWLSHKTFQIDEKHLTFSIYASKIATGQPIKSEDQLHDFMTDLYTYLSIFGQFIRTIKWMSVNRCTKKGHSQIFEMITRFCAKTLIHLEIIGRVKINITSEFQVLERFEFFYGDLMTFEPSHTLKYLRLTQLNSHSYSQIDLRFLEKNFPNLEVAHLGDFTTVMQHTDWFGNFLKYNPQLKSLTLIFNKYFVPNTAKIVRAVGKHSKNLECLHLDQFSVDIKDLRGLDKLKCLRIPYSYLKRRQIDNLIALDLPIEELEINLRTGDTYIAQRITKLKKIKKLNLGIRLIKGRPASSIIENLPPLDNLNIRKFNAFSK